MIGSTAVREKEQERLNRLREPHEKAIQSIINKIGRMRGNDPTISALSDVTKNIDRQMLAQLVRNQHNKDTMKQVKRYSRYNPTILKWLFDENQESMEDQNATQRSAITEF